MTARLGPTPQLAKASTPLLWPYSLLPGWSLEWPSFCVATLARGYVIERVELQPCKSPNTAFENPNHRVTDIVDPPHTLLPVDPATPGANDDDIVNRPMMPGDAFAYRHRLDLTSVDCFKDARVTPALLSRIESVRFSDDGCALVDQRIEPLELRAQRTNHPSPPRCGRGANRSPRPRHLLLRGLTGSPP
jgi:hypothetical protein